MPIIFICNRRSIKQITQKCSEEKIGLFFRRGAVPRGLARRGGKKKKKKGGKKKQGRKRGQTKIPVLFEVRRSTLLSLSLSALSRSSSPSFQTVLLFSPIAPAKDPLAKSAAFHSASSPSPNVTTNCSFRTPLSLSLHLFFFFFEKLDDSNDIDRVDRTFRFERTKRNGKEKKKIWRRRGSLSRERERENVCR